MLLFIAAGCLGLAVYIFWKIHNLDRDPNVPGPVSHVIVPAVAYPIVFLLVIVALIALAYQLLL